MPRAGGVYSAPPGTTATPNTTVQSAPYNALVADLVADANAARPVSAGGSGSATSLGGNDNLNLYGADLASAATVNLANATGSIVNITGTVTITALGTVAAGAERVLVFGGVLTFTHNATSLILPGGANITTAAGDVATMRSKGSGNWICTDYQRANGAPVAIPASTTIVTPTLTLKQSAAPTPTAEGDIQWDTDDNTLLIGDGAAAQTFVPFPSAVVAGDLFYASSAKALTRLAKGTAGQALLMNAGATAPSWATLPFTKSYESAQQTITAGGTLTLAHSLGVQPKLYMAVLQCTTANLGYSIADEVAINPMLNTTDATTQAISMVPDATNINVRIGAAGSSLKILNKGGTGLNDITNTSWRLVFRAWA
ncbi:hypothetical protein NKH85_17140 [Mesorhizobium sp. M0924]|uniref:hypothetical protein n=1 Tax=unclassified Mesorhizobium TaxID=325217 RepID=UPI00333D92E8